MWANVDFFEWWLTMSDIGMFDLLCWHPWWEQDSTSTHFNLLNFSNISLTLRHVAAASLSDIWTWARPKEAEFNYEVQIHFLFLYISQNTEVLWSARRHKVKGIIVRSTKRRFWWLKTRWQRPAYPPSWHTLTAPDLSGTVSSISYLKHLWLCLYVCMRLKKKKKKSIWQQACYKSFHQASHL